MAYTMTASLTSGYMTDVQYDIALGPFRCMVAHYSAPSAQTAYLETGMYKTIFYHIEDADPTTYKKTNTGAAVGEVLQFSGLITGSTGFIFALGY